MEKLLASEVSLIALSRLRNQCGNVHVKFLALVTFHPTVKVLPLLGLPYS